MFVFLSVRRNQILVPSLRASSLSDSAESSTETLEYYPISLKASLRGQSVKVGVTQSLCGMRSSARSHEGKLNALLS